jgi:hypothetical protein
MSGKWLDDCSMLIMATVYGQVGRYKRRSCQAHVAHDDQIWSRVVFSSACTTEKLSPHIESQKHGKGEQYHRVDLETSTSSSACRVSI